MIAPLQEVDWPAYRVYMRGHSSFWHAVRTPIHARSDSCTRALIRADERMLVAGGQAGWDLSPPRYEVRHKPIDCRKGRAGFHAARSHSALISPTHLEYASHLTCSGVVLRIGLLSSGLMQYVIHELRFCRSFRVIVLKPHGPAAWSSLRYTACKPELPPTLRRSCSMNARLV
jgi:hypothetical protein